MNDLKTLKKIRALEQRLSYAEPAQCAKLTTELVKLKNEFVCGGR